MSEYVTPAAPLRAIVEALVAGGVREVVICPGSRSTPLALALAATPALRSWVHLDERAGAFFALGAARATGRPAAVLTTSGTAAVELSPAVAEARYGRVPLVLLTADRPPELQGIGAPQTIDQVELFGRHAKWYAGLPVPDEAEESSAEARSIVERALAVAISAPAGPVQLDLPFREPLLPAGPLLDEDTVGPGRATRSDEPAASRAEGGPEQLAGGAAVPAEAVAATVQHARAAARPLLVCGPLDSPGFAGAITRLAAALGAPILADVLANLRTGDGRDHVLGSHEALLRSELFADAHRPDLLIRFGATPTSRALNDWLAAIDAPQLLIDDGAGWNRPKSPAVSPVAAEPVAFATAAAEAVAGQSSADPGWLADWLAADEVTAAALEAWFGRLAEPFEGLVARALPVALPAEAIVVAGNSMPVRDLDSFLPRAATPLRFLGNRGANGIDGLLSTALGVAAAQARPVVGVVGDLALLHDLTALAAGRRLQLDATFVLVDNDGGGIFSFLPQARAERPELGLPAVFETLFGTPHGLDLGPVVQALGARHVPVEGAGLAEQLGAAVGRPGIDVLHLRTERSRNAVLHGEAFAAAREALEAAS